MRKFLFDIETDAIDATLIRCVSFCDLEDRVIKTITSYEVMKKFFSLENVYFIGHNICMYDVPIIERVLNIKIKSKTLDTLGLSWTIFPNRVKHGLESYGIEYGTLKKEIVDYANQDIKEIIQRCEGDVAINIKVWDNLFWYLKELYEEEKQIYTYMEYISFKLWCVAEQQKLGVKLDISLVKETLMELEDLKINKIEALTTAMPKVPIKSIKKYPKVFKKANGELSANGQKWLTLLEEKQFPKDYEGDIEVITGYNEANPNSHAQIKDWLFSLGWEPGWYKYVREEGKSEMRKIPQVSSKDEPGEVCESIKKLIEKEPNIEELDGLGIISHRINVLKGFLRDQRNGRLYQGMSGLTNTLRLQHSVIVNLPNAKKPFSENIRASLIPDDSKILIGCDLTGIEDATKRHYIYKYDPDYIEEMNNPDFDPHLSIAVKAGFLTEEQSNLHKLYDKTKGKEGVSYKEERSKAKVANFALTYKCGIPTLMRQTGLGRKQAEALSKAYWDKNNAILKVEDSLSIKQIGSQMWLLNPVSGFWYSLRAEKDKFSTLNQSTAVYVFDLFVKQIIQLGIIPNFQYHDEWTGNIFEYEKELAKELVNKAIKSVNEELQLNVQIGCSIDYGKNYKEAH